MACLALQPDGAASKLALAMQLWPDTREKQARTNLRNLLHHIGHRTPALMLRLTTSRDLVELPDGPDLDVDVWRYRRLARAARAAGGPLPPSLRAELEDAVLRLAQPLLPECYDDWIVAHRQRLEALHGEILDFLVATAESEHNAADGMRYARWRMLDDTF